jgi:AraC family transcriptional regulator
MKKKTGKQNSQKLYIKNMVCDRCIRVVRVELLNLGLDVRSVTLGEADIAGSVNTEQLRSIKSMIEQNGFELIEDKNVKVIEAVKTAIIQLVHHNHDAAPLKLKYSEYISRTVGKDYHSLSVLFSSVENVTIEQYTIRQKIERVKELIKYDDRSLSEIAYMMNYSSVQHMSGQFKAVTGLTPSDFKKHIPAIGNTHSNRKPIDKVL